MKVLKKNEPALEVKVQLCPGSDAAAWCPGVHNPASFLVSFLVKEGTLQSDFGKCIAVQFTSVEVK